MLARSSKAILHTCCDVSEAALALCRERFRPLKTCPRWEDVVADPEVEGICLATTEKLREPVIAAAAEAGKAVYVEKPLAQTLEEMVRIRRVVEAAGIPFCVGHNRRAAPALLLAHCLFRHHMEQPAPCSWRWDREGAERPRLAEDGRPSIALRINDDWHSWKKWVFDGTQAPYGPMLFEMSHFTDICNWMMAEEPVEVIALETGMLNHAVIVRYRQGGLATITMCANGSWGYPKELYEMMGNGGMVAVYDFVEIVTAGLGGRVNERHVVPLARDPCPEIGQEGGLAGWLAKRRWCAEQGMREGRPERILDVGVDKGHSRLMEAFLEEVRGQGSSPCGVGSAILATRVCFAAIRSAVERRPVLLSEVPA